MNNESRTVPHGYQLFRVFRVSRLLPNVKGEHYQFKGISANTWLSHIGVNRDLVLYTGSPYKTVRPKSCNRQKEHQRCKSVTAETSRTRKCENGINRNEVVKGIRCKSRRLNSVGHTNESETEIDKGVTLDKGYGDKGNVTDTSKETELHISANESFVRPRTCPAYMTRRPIGEMETQSLMITSSVLRKPKHSSGTVADKEWDSNSEVEPHNERNEASGSDKCVTVKPSLDGRINSAPLSSKIFRDSNSPILEKAEAASPLFLKTRPSEKGNAILKPTGKKKGKLMRGSVLRSMSNKSSPELKNSRGCDDCFKACLVSDEYYDKLKELRRTNSAK